MAAGARGEAFAGNSVPELYDRLLSPVVFEPWARTLVEFAGVRAGQRVVDVASGTGAVARTAALRAGPGGRLVATDISATMLAAAASHPPVPGAAPIERVRSPATALTLPGGWFDVALCHQGLQFFDEPARAVSELRRVLREGGVAAVAIWDAGRRNEPFASYAEAVLEEGLPEPFAGAFDATSFTMSAAVVEGLVAGAGFASLEVVPTELTVRFEEGGLAVAAIMGTPYGALLERQDEHVRGSVLARVAKRLGGAVGRLELTQAAILARAVAS
jgi:ubiquinone/menaquinone biosynthesis C-methylase UbiE